MNKRLKYTMATANLSGDERYRWSLMRSWVSVNGDGLFTYKPRVACFIGLNPSVADADIDDPTLRRCVRFAQRLNYDSMYMMNLFAYRGSNPNVLLQVDNPVGVMCDSYLQQAINDSDLVVCCWGAVGKLLNRDRDVYEMIPKDKAMCFGLTKGGMPKHPLYLANTVKLMPYGGR